MMRRAFAVAALGLVLGGCSARTPSGGAGPRSSSGILTRAEIAAAPVYTAYEALEKLRPAMLRERTTSSGPGYLPAVFVDGIRKGSLEYLKTIPAGEVSEIRYLSVQDATTRYGMNVPAGVIDVKLIGR